MGRSSADQRPVQGRRQLLAVGATAAATVAAMIAAPRAMAQAAAPGPGLALAWQFNVGQFNLLPTLSDAEATADFERFLPACQIGGFNEFSGRSELINHITGLGYAYQVSAPNGPNGDVMFADPRVFHRDPSYPLGVEVGSPAMVDDIRSSPKKSISWIQYLHLATGTRVTHLHTHILAGWAPGAEPTAGERAQLAMAHLTRLRDMVQHWETMGAVILTGDLNVNYVLDEEKQHPGLPFHRLERETGLESNWTRLGLTNQTTKDSGYIDYVYHSNGPHLRQSGYGFRMHGHRVMRALHSDHNAVLVTMGPRD